MAQEIPLGNGDEYDAFTGWRKVFRWRPGVLKSIKRRYRRRCRRKSKNEIQNIGRSE